MLRKLLNVGDRKLTLAFENLRSQLPVAQDAAQVRGRQSILARQKAKVLKRIVLTRETVSLVHLDIAGEKPKGPRFGRSRIAPEFLLTGHRPV